MAAADLHHSYRHSDLPDGAIVVAARYPVFSGPAVERLRSSSLDEVVITNTIPLSEEARGCGKIRQLSVAFLFAETIRRISDGESVTSLFSEQNNNF